MQQKRRLHDKINDAVSKYEKHWLVRVLNLIKELREGILAVIAIIALCLSPIGSWTFKSKKLTQSTLPTDTSDRLKPGKQDIPMGSTLIITDSVIGDERHGTLLLVQNEGKFDFALHEKLEGLFKRKFANNEIIKSSAIVDSTCLNIALNQDISCLNQIHFLKRIKIFILIKSTYTSIESIAWPGGIDVRGTFRGIIIDLRTMKVLAQIDFPCPVKTGENEIAAKELVYNSFINHLKFTLPSLNI